MEKQEERNAAEYEKKEEDSRNAAIAGAEHDTVQRHGEAIKEHNVAYSGVNNETGQEHTKSLKGISESKVNPKDHERNIKQQAGYSAEVKAEARDNAEKAIKGEKNKTVRTDDMQKQSDGKGGSIGGVNDPLYDLAEVDKNGIYVEGTGRQLKFVGGNSDQCTDRLLQKKFDKYRDADIEIEVPSDFYDGVLDRLNEKTTTWQKQLERAQSNGETERVAQLKEKIERAEKTKKLLKKSNVSNKEAIFAREHPMLSTAQDIVKVSYRAGVEAAKQGAIVGGGISVIRNTVSVFKGEEEFEDAVKNVAKDTGSSAVVGFGTGAAGSVIKGVMQNAKSPVLRAASKTDFPAVVVTTAISTVKTMTRFLNQEIDGVECLDELGENGATTIASSLGAVVGQAAIPIPVLGAAIGSTVGYVMASASYGILTQALKEAKLAEEDRKRIESECAEHIVLIQEYRKELNEAIDNYLNSYAEIFCKSFDDMKVALLIGDVDGFIAGANGITSSLGKDPQFKTSEEFKVIMESKTAIKL